VTFWRLIHLFALFYLATGIGATIVPVWKAWLANELQEKVLHLLEAHKNEQYFLLPGFIATVFTGYAWAAAAGHNVITNGWLVALQILTWVNIFIFLPLMGVGLRRVRLLALAARKRGEETEELRNAMADNVPVVFGTLIALSFPVMTWLAVAQPF
jgi:hypothetical protein